MRERAVSFVVGVFSVLLLATVCMADGGVTFHDFAAREDSGIDYRRVPSEIFSIEERLNRLPALKFGHIIALPEKPRGAPGVALIDYDGDGDVDVYVTNGPRAANSLYHNQWMEAGKLGFRDVAVQAGVAAVEQDSTGVCFGDTDNDGDPDLLVLGRMEPNRFFDNQGDGTFVEVTDAGGLGGGAVNHTSCSMGDVDQDGLLDVVVANSFDWGYRGAIFNVPYADNHPNQLFRNLGGQRFADISEEANVLDIDSVQPAIDQGATLTWAVALVDYDLDGDVDLFHADDQAALPVEKANRAHAQVFQNDGQGRFRSVTREVGTDVYGAWMGFAFADFDCNGLLDFFATNFGDYGYSAVGFPYELGEWSSRWFLQRPDGTFDDPGVGELKATPFGWSPMAVDYDNDADTDVIYLGSLGTAVNTVVNDNPGAVLQNRGCTARFVRDAEAMTTQHQRRVVDGSAAGDLDLDGFPDVVSASAFDIPPEVEQKPYGLDWGSPFDATAVYTEFLQPAPGGSFLPKNLTFPDGRLVIDRNSGDNGNGWIAVRTVGGAGWTDGGRVNRSGIGAVVRVTPEGKASSMTPVTGGSGYGSQNALELTFGLGDAESATVEVLWPGGVRNRLDDVRPGERIVFPEIPCSFAGDWESRAAYRACVEAALADLDEAKALDPEMKRRFLDSALAAFRREARPDRPMRDGSAHAPRTDTGDSRDAQDEKKVTDPQPGNPL